MNNLKGAQQTFKLLLFLSITVVPRVARRDQGLLVLGSVHAGSERQSLPQAAYSLKRQDR